MSELSPKQEPAPKRLPVLLRRAWYGLNQAFRQRVAHLGITPDFTHRLNALSAPPFSYQQFSYLLPDF